MIDVKRCLTDLRAYTASNQVYDIKLDANETRNYLFPGGITIEGMDLHRYPDSSALKLRQEIGAHIGVDANQIIAGNGSSEMIDLIIKTYVEPGEVILSYEPSFSMYRIYSQIHGARFETVETKPAFRFDIDAMIEASKQFKAKLIFLCSPNNPTGLSLSQSEIERLMNETKGLVVLDEAYIEFSGLEKSKVVDVNQYDNLIVLRTMSKAYGLAGLRLGYLVSNPQVVGNLDRVRSPYNLNALAQIIGLKALKEKDKMVVFIDDLIKRRSKMMTDMLAIGFTVWPSDANFLFFKSACEHLHARLVKKGVLIRQFTGTLRGYYRVSVGTEEENKRFLEAVKEVMCDEKS